MKFAMFCCDLTLVAKNTVLQAPSHLEIWLQWDSTTGHYPTSLFQITLVLDNNIGLSLSVPLQLYQKQLLDSSAGYMYILWVQQDITIR